MAVGIDLGGTKTEAIILNSDGTILWRQRIPTPRVDGYNAILTLVSQMILEAVVKLPPGNPFTVGVGIPGSIDSSTNLVRNANSTCLIGHPLQSDIERLIGLFATTPTALPLLSATREQAGATDWSSVLLWERDVVAESASTAKYEKYHTGLPASRDISQWFLTVLNVTVATVVALRH